MSILCMAGENISPSIRINQDVVTERNRFLLCDKRLVKEGLAKLVMILKNEFLVSPR